MLKRSILWVLIKIVSYIWIVKISSNHLPLIPTNVITTTNNTNEENAIRGMTAYSHAARKHTIVGTEFAWYLERARLPLEIPGAQALSGPRVQTICTFYAVAITGILYESEVGMEKLQRGGIKGQLLRRYCKW